MTWITAQQMCAEINKALQAHFADRGFHCIVEPEQSPFPLFRQRRSADFSVLVGFSDSNKGAYVVRPWYGVRHEPTMIEYSRLLLIIETGMLKRRGLPYERDAGSREPLIATGGSRTAFPLYETVEAFVHAEVRPLVEKISKESERYWSRHCDERAVAQALKSRDRDGDVRWLHPIWFAVNGDLVRAREVAEELRPPDDPDYERFLEELFREHGSPQE